jgi:uncharacterized membrane protein
MAAKDIAGLKLEQFHPRLDRLTFSLITVLLLGIGLRLVNLDGKVYWHDEAYTSMRVSGYVTDEVQQQVFNGQVIDVTALERYQLPNPERGTIDTIKTLALDDAQHPPLYYVLVRYWVLMFGNSIAITRSFSVLSGLLVLPAVYLLCQALFKSPFTSLLATTLVAVSPFHLLYAQEAREYAQWTLLILLSSWALLRALQVKTSLSWAIYSVALILSLYTYMLTGLVMLGHGIYVVAIDRRRFIQYLLASLVALLSFAPWFWLVITTWSSRGVNWTAVPIPLLDLLKTWGVSLERAFALTSGDFGFDTGLVYATLPLLLILVGYAFYQLCRETPIKTWWFVLTLIGSTALPLALPDLILGGQRSTSSRYLVPCYLGMQLAVAYLLSSRLSSRLVNGDRLEKKFWQGVLAAVLLVSTGSCIQSVPADTAWNKVISYNNRAIANLVNASPQSLLITSSFGINFGNILALSHLLDPQVKLQLVQGASSPDFMNVPQIPQGNGSVFLLDPTDQFRQAVEQQQKTAAKLVFNDYHLFLWQLR